MAAYYRRLASGKLARTPSGKRATNCAAAVCSQPWHDWYWGNGPPGAVEKGLVVTIAECVYIGATYCGQVFGSFNLSGIGSFWRFVLEPPYPVESPPVQYCWGTARQRCQVAVAQTTVAGRPCFDITTSLRVWGEWTGPRWQGDGHSYCCLPAPDGCSLLSLDTPPYTVSASQTDENGTFEREYELAGTATFQNGTPAQGYPLYCLEWPPAHVYSFPTLQRVRYRVTPGWLVP